MVLTPVPPRAASARRAPVTSRRAHAQGRASLGGRSLRAAFTLALAGLALLPAAARTGELGAQSGTARRQDAAASERLRVDPARRGWFGFSFRVEREARAGRATTETVSVESVVSGSPADRAGLRRGDVLLLLDGNQASGRAIERVARRARAGDTLRLRVIRGSEPRELTLVAAARPEALHVVRGTGGGRLYLADSIAVRAQTVLDSIRANVMDVRLVVGAGGSGGPTEVIIRDAVGQERRLRVRQGEAESLARNLRQAFEVQRESAPTRIEIESARSGSEELRAALRDLERMRRDRAREESGLRASRDSTFVWREVRPPPRYGISMSRSSLGVAGAEFSPLAPEMRSYFGVDSGLLVLNVGPGTPAARARLTPGDVVITAGGRRTRSVAELAAALSRAGQDGLTLEVIRQKQRRTIRIPGP